MWYHDLEGGVYIIVSSELLVCKGNDWFDGRVIGNELEDEDCSAKENMEPFDYLSTLVVVRGRQLLCYLGHS